jgi:hypothetical protein
LFISTLRQLLWKKKSFVGWLLFNYFWRQIENDLLKQSFVVSSPFLKILTKEQKINPFIFNAFILKTDARKWWKKLKNKIELTVRFRSVYVNIGEGEISNLIKIVFGLLKSLKSVVGTNFTSSYAFSGKRSEVSHQL